MLELASAFAVGMTFSLFVHLYVLLPGAKQNVHRIQSLSFSVIVHKQSSSSKKVTLARNFPLKKNFHMASSQMGMSWTVRR